MLRNPFIAVSLFACGVASAHPFEAREPRFEIVLSSHEIEPMRFAAEYGISRYGGDVSFETRIARLPAPPGTSPDAFHDLSFTMLLRGQRTIDAWAFWCAEQTTQFLSNVNVDQLSERDRLSMKTLQSLNVKLTQAKLNPQWELTVTPALVGVQPAQPFGPATPQVPRDETHVGPSEVTLTAEGQTVRAFGSVADRLRELAGKRAIVKGYVKAHGVMEVVAAHELKEQTLELVIMSQCPFGMKAALAITEHVAAEEGRTGAAPKIEVRYLFYRQVDPTSSNAKWWSLHGEPEIEENLVQMAIRDLYPSKFRDYLRHRARQPGAKWQDLCGLAMLPAAEVEAVTQHMTAHREDMITREYEYVNRVLGVSDGSPTFVWESQRVNDLSKLLPFATLTLGDSTCSGNQPQR